MRLAKEHGRSLTGPDGLLRQFTKTLLETVLDEEMTEHICAVPGRIWCAEGILEPPNLLMSSVRMALAVHGNADLER